MLERLGEDGCEALLRADNEPAATTLRVNTLKTDCDSLCTLLREQGIECRPVPGLDNALETAQLGNPARLRAFRDGLFYIQDAAGQRCVAALAPTPGSFVIDMCAAPGGKTLLCAQMMHNQGRILAMDIHPHKAALIEKNAVKYGADIIEAVAADASKPVGALRQSADFVLCDVPCSGFGVIRKKPDIRFKKPEDIAGLPALQQSILCTAGRICQAGRPAGLFYLHGFAAGKRRSHRTLHTGSGMIGRLRECRRSGLILTERTAFSLPDLQEGDTDAGQTLYQIHAPDGARSADGRFGAAGLSGTANLPLAQSGGLVL